MNCACRRRSAELEALPALRQVALGQPVDGGQPEYADRQRSIVGIGLNSADRLVGHCEASPRLTRPMTSAPSRPPRRRAGACNRRPPILRPEIDAGVPRFESASDATIHRRPGHASPEATSQGAVRRGDIESRCGG